MKGRESQVGDYVKHGNDPIIRRIVVIDGKNIAITSDRARRLHWDAPKRRDLYHLGLMSRAIDENWVLEWTTKKVLALHIRVTGTCVDCISNCKVDKLEYCGLKEVIK